MQKGVRKAADEMDSKAEDQMDLKAVNEQLTARLNKIPLVGRIQNWSWKGELKRILGEVLQQMR